MVAIPKPIREEDEAYLDYVRSKPCLICGTSPVDANHVHRKGHGKTGGKTHDTRTVPLCRNHHQQYHDNGRAWFELFHGIDLEREIARLRGSYRPQRKQQRELQPKVLHIAVRCICKQIHKLPPSKVNGGWQCPLSKRRVEAL